MVVNTLNGRFGFVHESNSKDDTVVIFYPYPELSLVVENDSDIDFCALDGKEFKYID